jgi:two-component system phosphate regulon sensor histidine kinase PhoR
MKKKPSLFRNILGTITLVLLASIVLFTYVLYNNFTSNVEADLKQDAYLISVSMDDDGTYLKSLEFTDDTRVTWIDEDGTVLYDSEADASTMENHSSRPEVREAFLDGEGEAVRTSTTISKKTIYYALLLDDNTVLRVSRSYDSMLILMLRLISPVLWTLIFGLIASIILRNRIEKLFLPKDNLV